MRIEDIRQRLREFAQPDALDFSQLYVHLASHAVADDELFNLLTPAPDQVPVGPLLFAIAHRLVHANPIHPLARYYPTVGGMNGIDDQTWPVFRGFLLDQADRVRVLAASRYPHSYDVQWAAPLYPAVAMAVAEARAPVALVELGGTGLLLDLDTFGYRYHCVGGKQLVAGSGKAAVGVHCALELAPGVAAPTLPKRLAVSSKLGVTNTPIDLADEEELAWLEACLRADQPARLRLWKTAIAARRGHQPPVIAGDPVVELANAVQSLPADSPIVLLTSHFLGNLSQLDRPRLIAEIAQLAGERALWWISDEPREALVGLVRTDADFYPEPWATQQVAMVTWREGAACPRILADTAPGGDRMRWRYPLNVW